MPDNNEGIYVVGKDKEQQVSLFLISMKHDATPDSLKSNLSYMVFDYARDLISQMINARFSEEAQKPESPFLQVGAEEGQYLVSRTKDMADYRRVFNNNKYGWALYTDNPTYGRHPSVATYAVKFDQVYSTFYKSISTVRLPGVADKDSVVSMYSFKMDNGIVLSFDTYNGFFHYYADQSQYFAQDLQGDFEFCLDRYSENEDLMDARMGTAVRFCQCRQLRPESL